MDRKFSRKREIAKDTTPRLLQYSHIVSVGKTNFQVKKRSTVRMGKQHIFLEARTALQSAVCLRELLLSLDPDSHMAELGERDNQNWRNGRKEAAEPMGGSPSPSREKSIWLSQTSLLLPAKPER